MSFYLIKSDARITQIDPTDFDGIRALVGGYVEVIHAPPKSAQAVIWCNEDGKPLGLFVNALATALWWHLNPSADRNDRLRGDIVITGQWKDDETIADAPDDVAELLAAYIK